MTPTKEPRPPAIIGWIEMVSLPDLDLPSIKAKIDTGARTSALHATDIEPFVKDGASWLRFRTLISDDVPSHLIEAPIHTERAIKNTSGIPEDRFVIRTKMKIGKRSWAIDLSITDRANMTFPMIIGRAALKNHNIVVHTRKAYLMTSNPPTKSRKDTK